MRRFLPVLALFLAGWPRAEAATLNEDIVVTGQRPVVPGANVWFEGGFSEFPALGPQFAKGLVIWNHPTAANGQGAGVSTAKAISGMAALGWDIIRLQRNPRLAPAWENRLSEVRETLTQEVAQARTLGYQRIILAGQGFGGGLALEAAKTIDNIYAVIAFAPNTGDGLASIDRTWSQLREAHAARLVILFPAGDEQVTQPRGATAHDLLAARQGLSYLLVDETSDVHGNTGAETTAFGRYATCMDYFLAPDAAPHAGEFHCGVDEVPAALARMAAKPHGGEAWFGYSNRGLETYLELPVGGGPVLYGQGYGADGRGKPAVRSYEARPMGAGFTFDLNKDLTVRGLKQENELRLTVDLPDGTRSSVLLHRLSGNS
ncbi:MAG TPA: hypothetical protein VGV37_19860 [Aliidongia sp.]|uniref:hypothetical protein n=1 Tax=Aliidongia sp. TaxID=1914230 RepID=UPI002DDDA37C|nr:hypothetical protein [Aliidongia sp.]HEV2676792.1 hypothetical protein [Aliidongia sp.]